ncbi:MAG: hypothetical protein ABIY51_03055 [Ferruginibacter sp.]
MEFSLRKWLTVSFLNLLLVSTLGIILRYKIAFYLPFIEQKFVLHSHSHFAFAGWITQTLMLLLVHNLSIVKGESMFKKYRWLLYANLVTAYGMLISFFFQGYAFFSISFSTLSIFVSYLFAIYYWKDLNNLGKKLVSHYWYKAALVFSVISSLGAFGLAFMMANKMSYQHWYLGLIYFFLHFQYNGWFFFAGMGLLSSRLEKNTDVNKKLKAAFMLFCFACIPAYFLSALWLPFPRIIYYVIIAAVVAQLYGWILLLKVFKQSQAFIKTEFSKYGKILFILAAIAFTIKLLLQSGSIHPALSQLSYSFRPIIIGYLHLVLLAVTSIFIIAYIVSFNLIPVTKLLLSGIAIFVTGIIINELLLMLQGITSITYNNIPAINIFLLIAAMIMFTGIALMLISRTKKLNSLAEFKD